MFWEQFYNLCKEIGSAPNTVAKELDISSGSVTKWKNGSVPSGETLMKIAEYFNVSVDYLLNYTIRKDVRHAKKTTGFKNLSIAQRAMAKHQLYSLLVVHYRSDNFVADDSYRALIGDEELIESSLRWFRLPQDYSYDNAGIVSNIFNELNISLDTLFENKEIFISLGAARQLNLEFDANSVMTGLLFSAHDVFRKLAKLDLTTVYALDKGLYSQITFENQLPNPYVEKIGNDDSFADYLGIAAQGGKSTQNEKDRAEQSDLRMIAENQYAAPPVDIDDNDIRHT